ncbi:hypothetical protein GH733_004372 [Mirounga leonina]|nr:hypothetical protein GH733_004372 [Mirounga leonina]
MTEYDWVGVGRGLNVFDSGIPCYKFGALRTATRPTPKKHLSRQPLGYTDKPPAIDWAYYKANVAKAGLVDDFEKKFNALKVPVPEDKYTVQVDAEEKEDVKSCAEFLSLSKARIEEYEKELEKMRNIIPFDQMTIEDLNEVFPETKLDKKKTRLRRARRSA